MSFIYGTAGNDSLVGSADGPGNSLDYLVGREGNDTLAAGGVSQTLDGLAGDDVLIGKSGTQAYGGQGHDLLQGVDDGFGDDGNDTITGFTGAGGFFGSSLRGGGGNDSIIGTDHADLISGGGGTNVIIAGAGNDVFMAFDYAHHGGIVEYGSVVSDGHPGSNTIDGGPGNDTLRFSEFVGGSHGVLGNARVDLASGTATTESFIDTYSYNNYIGPGYYQFSSFENAETGDGADSINGTSGANYLEGNKGADTISGGEGDDRIVGDSFRLNFGIEGSNLLRGEGGNDSIAGGDVADRIEGGSGADTVDGGDGADLVFGGDGADRLDGGRGADTLTGGAGADTFVFYNNSFDAHAAFANVVTDWSPGEPLLFEPGLFGSASRGYVERTAVSYDAAYDDATAIIRSANVVFVATQVGSDVVIFADTSARQFESAKTLDDAVILQGRSLSDISAASIQNAVAVDIGAGPTPPPGGTPPAGGPPSAGGGVTFEAINPSAALTISATDKVVFSGGSATQASILYGADTITIVLGGTTVVFGPGIAAASQAGNLAFPDGSAFYIGLGEPNSFVGRATGDAAFGGLGDDTLDGAAGGDLLHGNQGVDRLIGGDGDDTVYGGQDDDILLLGDGLNFGQGNKGQDMVTGGAGADTLLGGQDNDTIQGDAGPDLLIGNRGDDSIAGGAGNDTLYGESGTDVLSGGAGADAFHAYVGQEIDRIVDFDRAAGDRIVLNPGVAYNATQVGSDVVVTLGGSDQFVLVGVSLASLTGDWIGP